MNQHQNIRVETVRANDLFSGTDDDTNLLKVTVPVTVDLFFESAEQVTPERIYEILGELVREDTENVLGLRAYGLEAPLVRDRPHRFAVGDMIAHVDAPQEPIEVLAQTWRMREGVAYPTYTITGATDYSEEIDDVLDTLDLQDFDQLQRDNAELAR